jgi:hypothetical protein
MSTSYRFQVGSFATRRRLLDQAAAEGTQVMIYHFPFPGLGHIVADDGGWAWDT